MIRPGDIRPRLLALAVLLTATLLTGCNGAAFESNDYFMDYLTSIPTGDQVMTSAGYVDETVTKAAVHGQADALNRQLVEESHEQAMEAFGAGDLDIASDLLDEAVASRPDDIGLRRDRAEVALAAGDVDQALIQWEEQDRIARKTGWDQSAKYWDDLVAEADEMRAATSLDQGMDNPDQAVVGAARIRYGDALDGQADFKEASGEDPTVVSALRTQAEGWRANGTALMDSPE